ncbi:hypothetical protein ACIRO1_43740 [Streptomyces sp. NPDC102381]|uniref:hypothetical protein n=1 Tax=Streptomyces sp. NPDC102381 TaxID=3366164 RepID=UPI00382B402A
MPLTPLARSGPRRRTLLASLAGAALLTGCSDAEGGADGGSGAPAAAQEKRLRTQAARESSDLLGQYDRAVSARPALAERLNPLRAEVERHVKAFGGARRPSGAAAPPGGKSAAAPASEKDILKALSVAEQRLSDRRMSALVDAPGELARLLASVAAAGAGHAYLLSEDGRK